MAVLPPAPQRTVALTTGLHQRDATDKCRDACPLHLRSWGSRRGRSVQLIPGAGALLLARASTEHQATRVGDETGGRVFLFLYTDDFWRDFNAYKSKESKSSESRRQKTAPLENRTALCLAPQLPPRGHPLGATRRELPGHGAARLCPDLAPGIYEIASRPLGARASRISATIESTITRCEPHRVRTVRSRPSRIR